MSAVHHANGEIDALAHAGRWREHVVEYRPGYEAAALDRKLKPKLLQLHGGKAESVYRALKLYLKTPTIIDDFASHEERREYRTSLHFASDIDPDELEREEQFRKNNRLRQNFLLFIWTTLESAQGITDVQVGVDLEELKARIKRWDDTSLEEKLALLDTLDAVCYDVFTQLSE